MNLQTSITRLSESVRKLILSQHSIKNRHDHGQSLASILSDRDWAITWAEHADEALVLVLRRVLIEFAGTPFEIEKLISKVVMQEEGLNGAEIKVAVARLRTVGILFGIRKAWGDRLLYLPVDTVAMWQSLLLPFEGEPIAKEISTGVTILNYVHRLPLSLELLCVWQSIYRYPLVRSIKGTLSRAAINRAASEMFITPAELESLKLSYPQQQSIPAPLAFAIDIGLCNQVLVQVGNELCVHDAGLQKWLRLSPVNANIQLYELIMLIYGSEDPRSHLIAAAVATLPVKEWFAVQDLRDYLEQVEQADQWLSLLEAFGWIERGMLGEKAVFRKNGQLEVIQPNELNDRDKFLVQPDGEIIVPPETGLAARWMLKEISEKVTADHLFVYRLTQRACVAAHNRGYSLHSINLFLEKNGAGDIPESCRRALQDWFAPLGKVRITEVMLLRTESAKLASILSEDPLLHKLLMERIGDRDYIVEASAIKTLQARLVSLGYPLSEPTNSALLEFTLTDGTEADNLANVCIGNIENTGWISKKHVIGMYDSDGTIPSKQELFPGITSTPSNWMLQPREYHSSTSMDIIQKAMDWQVAVRMGEKSEYCTFIPIKLEREGTSWSVTGSRCEDGERIVMQADEMKEIMIVLPPLIELESI